MAELSTYEIKFYRETESEHKLVCRFNMEFSDKFECERFSSALAGFASADYFSVDLL